MNRRGFVSMLLGAAGAPLVPWRGLVDPVIVLPGQASRDVTVLGQRLRPGGYVEMIYDATVCRWRVWQPTHVSIDGPSGTLSVGGYFGAPLKIRHRPQITLEGLRR